MFFDHRACVLVLDEQLVAPGRHRAVCGPAIWWLTPCPLLRFLWCEAAAHAVRRDPELKRFNRLKFVQKGLGKARVAVARKLGIRLWIMLRDEIDYQEFCRRGRKQQRCAGMPEVANGATLRHRPID